VNPDREAWEKHVKKINARLRPIFTAAERLEDRGASSSGPPIRSAGRIDADQAGPPPHKYGARAVIVDGIRFASTKEATRYQELRLLAAAGRILDLEVQPRYPIQVVELWRGGPPYTVTHCGIYTADFRYVETATGEVVTEDTKSHPTKTTAYKLRKKLIEAIHGITIREV
jgi:hypothetical protein